MSPANFTTSLLLSKALDNPESGHEQNWLVNRHGLDFVVLSVVVLSLSIGLLSTL
ncbi:UNVERIFIED_ORG: hypothetical protein GGI63_005292 [Rhizobium esperanzae]|nr:hypothetical protein RHECNPAF_11840019 [Rhizobium etli CNPAF512]